MELEMNLENELEIEFKIVCDNYVGGINYYLVHKVNEGNIEAVKLAINYLIEENNFNDKFLNRALSKALFKKRIDIVELLIDNGAIITPSMVKTSIIKGNLSIIEWLIEGKKYKTDNECDNKFYNECFMIACIRECFDIMDLFLKNGADINYEKGKPLIYALKECKKYIIKYLIENGADIDFVINNDNYSIKPYINYLIGVTIQFSLEKKFIYSISQEQKNKLERIGIIFPTKT